jgi:hypothetical protein
MMVIEQWIGKDVEGISFPNLRMYPVICLERLNKTTKKLKKNRLSLGKDLNSGTPEYQTRVLTTRPWTLVEAEQMFRFWI